jgi:hypothetical protein
VEVDHPGLVSSAIQWCKCKIPGVFIKFLDVGSTTYIFCLSNMDEHLPSSGHHQTSVVLNQYSVAINRHYQVINGHHSVLSSHH